MNTAWINSLTWTHRLSQSLHQTAYLRIAFHKDLKLYLASRVLIVRPDGHHVLWCVRINRMTMWSIEKIKQLKFSFFFSENKLRIDDDRWSRLRWNLEFLALFIVFGALGEIGDHAEAAARVLDDGDGLSPPPQGVVGRTFGLDVEVFSQVFLNSLPHGSSFWSIGRSVTALSSPVWLELLIGEICEWIQSEWVWKGSNLAVNGGNVL